MKLKSSLQLSQAFKVLSLVFGASLLSTTSRANVYATNIKLNDGMTNIVSPAGTNVQISYILNEPASRVEVDILSGTNVIRRLNLTDISSTSFGPNSVTWDELDSNSNQVPAGVYRVSVTAASAGYTNWTHILSDQGTISSEQDTNYVFWGEGIAVDRNPTSPHYGRVFVANAEASGTQNGQPGDLVGIMKLNADGSPADEGGTSADQDGYTWSDNGISPWKLAVSDDDFVYVGDLGSTGQVLRWDPLVMSNSLAYVLRKDNIPTGLFSGPAILGTGTNTQIFMADTSTNSRGIIKWVASMNGLCATNDFGTVVVASNANLTLGPIDVAVDKAGNIYTCQAVFGTLDPAPRVLRFPAYDPSTNGGQPELAADWAVGAGDDTYAGANGIAVDPTGTYVAVAFQGTFNGSVTANGNTKVLYATNGALVANLDLGVPVNGDPSHSDTACGWDAVGNVYYIDYYGARWRVVSPPGTNQSTTEALATIQVTGGGTSGPPPIITGINASGSTVTIDFTGLASDTISSFLVVGSATVLGPFSQVNNATIIQLSPGVFRATVTNSGAMQYFRIQRVGGSGPPPGQPPLITNLTVTGGNVAITFTGQTTDTASLFTLLNSPVAIGPYTTNTSATITPVSSGVFRASTPASGPIQFYRLQR
jgi:hypothetical protein